MPTIIHALAAGNNFHDTEKAFISVKNAMQFNPKSGEWLSMSDPMPIRAPEPQKPVPQPEKKLAVVLPFIEKEINQATALLLKSFDLSGQIPRNLFLVPFKGIKYDMVLAAAKQAFQSVGIIHDMEGKTSDWQKGERMRDASGPNTFFHQTAWFFYLNNRFPIFLWLEPDCTPITKDWLYQLENEYISMNKPFMGAKMRMPDGKEYMNGVGIYPWNLIQYEPLLVQSTRWKQFPEIEAAFDVAGGKKILDQAHVTRKIQLTLNKTENVKIRPETVLVHGRTDLSSEPAILTANDRITEQTPKVDATQNTLGGDVQCHGQEDRTLTNDAAPTVQPSGAAACEAPQPRHPIKSSAPSQSKNNGKEYGGLVKQIRKSVQSLVDLNISPSRKVLIVKELRRAKLVPKHFR